MDCIKNVLKIFQKDREQAKEDLVNNIVSMIVDNLHCDFSYEEQAELIDKINSKFLEVKKKRRGALIGKARKHIEEAREIQDKVINKSKTNE